MSRSSGGGKFPSMRFTMLTSNSAVNISEREQCFGSTAEFENLRWEWNTRDDDGWYTILWEARALERKATAAESRATEESGVGKLWKLGENYMRFGLQTFFSKFLLLSNSKSKIFAKSDKSSEVFRSVWFEINFKLIITSNIRNSLLATEVCYR